MSAPNEGYGQYPPQQQPYADQPQDGYDPQAAQAPQATAADHGKKKKRGYATQAYEFGAGANSNAAGAPAQAPGGLYGMPQPQAPAYGGYPQPDAQPAAGAGAYGSPQPQQYGMPQPAAAPAAGYGGYQAPDAGYPAPGGAPPAGGVAGLNQQMAGMNLGGQPQQPAPGQAARPMALNQLYPTDLMNQPFNVSELDLPPPPIILPPNVCHRSFPVPKLA